MIRMTQTRIVVACVVVLAVALTALWSSAHSADSRADDSGRSAGPAHYTVVMTEGHNLLVTDNATNKLYFYTIDKDKPIGSPLKLRALVNLTKVGEKEINITEIAVEKSDK